MTVGRWVGEHAERDPRLDEHVRVELRDGLDDSVVLVGMDPVEYRTMQTVPRRIGVDTRQCTHPPPTS